MRLPTIAPTSWPSTPLDARRYASVLAPPLLGSAAFPALADAARPVPGAEPPAFALVLAFLVAQVLLRQCRSFGCVESFILQAWFWPL